jgi:GNAT superfamily N-acetyltransferase
MIIQRCEKKDMPNILEIYRRAFDSLYPAFQQPPALTNPFEFAWFDAEGCLIAKNDAGKICGFALAQLMKNTPDGFLMTLFVDPGFQGQGIGGSLLERIENFCRKNCKTRLKLSPGAKNYFNLGVEENSSTFHFFASRGFQEDAEFGYRPLWMQSDPRSWRLPPLVENIGRRLNQEGIQVRISFPEDADALLMFMQKSFPGWYHELMVPSMSKNKAVPVSIAVKDSRVVGFTGPLYVDAQGTGTLGAVGVDVEFRGRGIARAVFNHACKWWQENGATSAHLWTGVGNPAVKVYEEAGLKVFRTYVPFVKNLT